MTLSFEPLPRDNCDYRGRLLPLTGLAVIILALIDVLLPKPYKEIGMALA